ncbi:MAG: DUF3592 domain-containing protein [Kiritimatiellaceae bacterium]|nr:DUF3592 domain-containing protein [Kiritimatiellaceae bacterium]
MNDFNAQKLGGLERWIRLGGGLFAILFGIAFAAMPAQWMWGLLKESSCGSGRWFFVLFLAVFVLAGLSVVVHGIRLMAGKGPLFQPRRSPADTRAEYRPGRTSTRRASEGRWFGVLFGLIFFLAGCGFFYGIAILPTMKILKARAWYSMPAEVIHSSVKEHSDSDGCTYSVDIGYRYPMNGVDFFGNRYSFFGGSSSGYRGKQSVVSHYPVGRSSTVYVNPDDPSDSVICRGFTRQAWVMLFPLPFMAVGWFVMVISWRPERRVRLSYGTLNRRHEQIGPVELKPVRGRFATAVLLLFMSLFWNGIVSVFVAELLSGWQEGRGEIGGTLFILPFVLIGLVLIGAFIRNVMKLSNPRVIVTLNSNRIVLGEPVAGRLRTEGACDRLENLLISLVGREEASYQRGTTTHTDKIDFYDEILLEKPPGGGVVNSEVRFTVPAHSMHSFAGLHNKVVWFLRVKGVIRGWPDLNEEYPVEVLPLEGAVS